MTRSETVGLTGVAVVLAAAATLLVAYGLWSAWIRHADGDLRQRAAEYALFRDGVYPNAHLEAHPAPHRPRYTVYPPYAFPLLACFFEPGGIVQGRLLLQSLSLASYAVMAIYAFRRLIPYGRPIAAVGALAGPAIAGNGSALAVGQFSIVCVGFVVLQLSLLERRRPMAAGICWALAMIKPQIGLPFGLLFLVGRQWIGMLTGMAGLAVLTLVASWWTEVSLVEIFSHWAHGMSLRFTEEGGGIGPGAVARTLGIDHRTVQFMALALLAASGWPVLAIAGRFGTPALLPLAGACSVAGMLCFYHRHYDNVMLFPAVLAALEHAAATRRPVASVLAGSMLSLLLVPQVLLGRVPWHAFVQGGVWMAACGLPLWMALASQAAAAPLNGISDSPSD